ncbi:MAG: amidohydrolase family protein, partial [Planctomycetes bacterium]|nr:amidohydrolase family protein [Planctomycetota bacterium]
VGTQNGPLARLAELQRMRGDLVAAKKYAEAWEKYEKDLEKYEKDLAEWAKKNAGKKKPDTASKSDKKEATATPPQNDPRRRTPRRRTRSFEEFFGVPLDPSDDGPWLPRLEDDSAVGSAEAMHPMQRFVEAAHRGEGHEPFSVPTSPPQLRREPTLPGSGINPHLRPEETIDPFDLSRLQIPICADCGGVIEGAYGDHQHEQGWDFWQFAPEEEKKDEPKDAAAAKTATRPGTADKSGGQPKKPAQPKYDPHAEVVGLALKGKLGVRIEVHRAEDILNVLALIEEYPMRAVLEGVTEGYRVADRIAKSGLPVVLRPWPIDPPAQASASGGGFPGLPFPFPAGFPMPRRGASRQSSTTPLEGEAHFDNAARLHAAGVKVAFGSLDDSPETSASLLSLAAWAAGHGMPRDAALSAVTAESAAVLGQDRIGSLSRGKQASFVVMTGHPFEATSQVERVYLDGKRVYKN